MSGKHWFIVGIVLFLIAMFIVEYNLPKKFVWIPTFGEHDKQPFGCEVFDDMVATSLPQDYFVSRESLYQIAENEEEPQGILAIAQDMNLTDTDVESVFNLARRGNVVMLASHSFGRVLEDTLGVSSTYGYFSPAALKRYASSLLTRDTLYWVGDSGVYKERIFRCYPQLCSVELEQKKGSRGIPLVEKWGEPLRSQFKGPFVGDTLVKERVPVALSYPVGEGEIILVATPLLFTNYGMLDADNSDYLFRLFTHFGELPVVRTEAFSSGAQPERSPLRYFLSQAPLRWALYLTLLALALFMIFTARRRQRVIPVIHEPANKNLEFTELIGTLYYQKKNHADLVRKKFTYFAEHLRRTLQVDVEDDSNDVALSRRIARKTGEDEEKVLELFRLLRPVMRGEVRLGEQQMKKLIDDMNRLVADTAY